MNWKGISKNCLSSDEGYLVSRYALQPGHGYGYVVRCPAGKIIFSTNDQNKAKAACVNHFESKQGVAA